MKTPPIIMLFFSLLVYPFMLYAGDFFILSDMRQWEDVVPATMSEDKKDSLRSRTQIRLLEQASRGAQSVGENDSLYAVWILLAALYTDVQEWERADSCYLLAERALAGKKEILPTVLKDHAILLLGKEDPNLMRAKELLDRARASGLDFTPELTTVYDVISKGIPYPVKRDFNYRDTVSALHRQNRVLNEENVQLNVLNHRFERHIWTVICILVIFSALSFAIILHQRYKHKAEILRFVSLQEKTRMLLRETEKEKDSYKTKYLARYKKQFALLQRIAEDSLLANQRIDPDGYLLMKVKELTYLVSDDKRGHEEFESILNQETSDMMMHYRLDFPNKQEKTYWLVSFLLAGFDATVISLLLDYSVESVYVIKSRLIKEIRASDSIWKDGLLELLMA